MMMAPSLWAAQAAMESPSTYDYIAGEKFLRGLANLATAPLEMPLRYHQLRKDHSKAASLGGSATVGVAKFLRRFTVGAFETVTFLLPQPWGGKNILEPEFVYPELVLAMLGEEDSKLESISHDAEDEKTESSVANELPSVSASETKVDIQAPTKAKASSGISEMMWLRQGQKAVE